MRNAPHTGDKVHKKSTKQQAESRGCVVAAPAESGETREEEEEEGPSAKHTHTQRGHSSLLLRAARTQTNNTFTDICTLSYYGQSL